MLDKYVSPGDKVELRLLQEVMMKNGEQEEKVYVSKINQILDEDKLEILMPIEQSRLVLLPRNTVFVIVVYTTKGLYQCEVKMSERYKSGNILLQTVELVSPLKRYQRREFYRYNCALPIFSRSLTEEEKEMLVWDETVELEEGMTVDIGGGGVRFRTEHKYEPQELILCLIRIEVKGEAKDIETIGKVLAVSPVKNAQTQEIRVQFKKISNKDRESIIQFVFEDERKRRKHDNGL